jgi:shikimate kinase
VLDRLTPRIIALGGGAWTLERNRELIIKHGCLTVWLDAPFETCWKRIGANPENIRPLAPDRTTAEGLHHARRASYLLAQLRVDATQALPEIVAEITRAAS